MLGVLRNVWRWLRRHQLLAVFVLALVGAGATTGGAFLWQDSHLRAARQALRRCDFDEARRQIDLCLRLPFAGADLHLVAAETARRRDAYDEADKELTACEQLGGITEATRRERLLLAAQQGDADGGALPVDPPAGDDPDAVAVLEVLAKGYANRFWHKDALPWLNELLAKEPRHPQAFLLRARAWEALARDGALEHEQDALHDYEQAVEVAPSLEARLGLAAALFRVGRPRDALFEYESLEGSGGADPRVLLGAARCLYSLHEVEKARLLLNVEVTRNPDSAGALLERGQLALHAGEAALAEPLLRRAAELAPPYEREAQRLLCRCLEAEGKDAGDCQAHLRETEAEIHRVERLVQQANRNLHDVALRYEVAMDLMRLGREEEAVAALFQVLELAPEHGPAHAALADYFERTGQVRRAAYHRRAAAVVRS